MNHDLVVYQFSRSKVQRGDFSHFLSVYGRDKLPAGRKLREMRISIQWSVISERQLVLRRPLVP